MGIWSENLIEDAIEGEERAKTRERRENYEQKDGEIRQATPTAPVVRDDETPIFWGHDVGRGGTAEFPPLSLEVVSQIPPGITSAIDPDFQRRNVYWAAFASKASELRRVYQSTAEAVTTFRDAGNDPDIKALSYTIGPAERVSADKATERERVPDQGPRQSVGALFDEANDLAFDEQDMEATREVRRSVDDGTSDVKARGADAWESDEAVEATMSELRGLQNDLLGAVEMLRAKSAALAARQKHDEALQVEEKIEGYRLDAEKAAEAVEIVADIGAMILHVVEDGFGDALEKIGDLAARVVSHLNDRKIARAKELLTALRVEEANASHDVLIHEFGKAGFDVAAILGQLQGKSSRLRIAHKTRKQQYDGLGRAASNAVSSSPSRAGKVGAALAAIPLVEMVVAKADAIVLAARVPSYDEAAGRGLGIAHSNEYPQAKSFLRASDNITRAGKQAVGDRETWLHRRDELFLVRDSMIGPRGRKG